MLKSHLILLLCIGISVVGYSQSPTTYKTGPLSPDKEHSLALNLYNSIGFGPGYSHLAYKYAELPNHYHPKLNVGHNGGTINASFRYSLGTSLEYGGLELGIVAGPEVYQFGQNGLSSATINSIFHYGLFLDYNIRLGGIFSVAPTGGFNTFTYFKNKVLEEGNDRDVSEYFTNRRQYHFGLKFKILLDERSYLGIGVVRRITHYDAADYFINIQPGTIVQEMKQTYFDINYAYRLWQK